MEKYPNIEVNLMEVLNIIRNKYNNYESMLLYYQNEIDNKLKRRYIVVIEGFNFKNNELTLSFDLETISFKKEKNIYISNTTSIYGYNLLMALEKIISSLYDEFLTYKPFFNEYKNDIKIGNNGLYVDISRNGLFVNNLENNKKENYIKAYSNEKKYEYYNDDVKRNIQGKEEEIFSNININLEDIPVWIQDTIINNQLKKK